jgi:hypothetical protein
MISCSADVAGTIIQRKEAELCRPPIAALQDHQVSVIEPARAHAHQDLFRCLPKIFARSQDDPIDAAEAVDMVRFHAPSTATAAGVSVEMRELVRISNRDFLLGFPTDSRSPSP